MTKGPMGLLDYRTMGRDRVEAEGRSDVPSLKYV
jgi:hypothetical protein